MSSCVCIPGKATRPTTQAKHSNVYGPGLNAQRALKCLNLWRGCDPLSRTRVALNPERLQGKPTTVPIRSHSSWGQAASPNPPQGTFLNCSAPVSQAKFYSTSLGWLEPRKVKYTVKLGEGSQVPVEGLGGSRHCFRPRPQIQQGKAVPLPLHLARHLWLRVLLQKRNLMLKEHSISGCFSSLMANRAADISG